MLRIRLEMAGLTILKHMHDLSNEVLCERWIENPYYQLFCGEEFFQHALVFDRSSMTRWRQRMGEESDDDSTAVTIRGTSAISACPSCGAVSDRVHSRYPRRLADLPIAGRRVVLVLQARRFRCGAVRCARRIFTERFDDNILKPWARRTARLDQIIHCLALALGGRPAASFAHRLSMPVSNDTLLRAVRRRGRPPNDQRRYPLPRRVAQNQTIQNPHDCPRKSSLESDLLSKGNPEKSTGPRRQSILWT